jgi:hypothetical protein
MMRSFTEFRPPAAAATEYLVFDVSPSDTVEAVVRRAEAMCGGPAGRRASTLVYGGKRLRGDRSLSDYDIRAGDSLALAPRARRDTGTGAPRGRFSPSDDAGCKGYAGSPVDAAAMGVGAQLAAGPGVWPARAVPRAVPVALTAFMVAAPRLWP